MGKQIEDFLDKEEKKLTSRETFNNNVEKFGFLYVKNENKKKTHKNHAITEPELLEK
jgi:hypothetical protein